MLNDSLTILNYIKYKILLRLHVSLGAPYIRRKNATLLVVKRIPFVGGIIELRAFTIFSFFFLSTVTPFKLDNFSLLAAMCEDHFPLPALLRTLPRNGHGRIWFSSGNVEFDRGVARVCPTRLLMEPVKIHATYARYRIVVAESTI